MKELSDGYRFDKLPFEELRKYADLLEYDGPLLSHFKDSKGRDILSFWVDCDSHANRWLFWRIDTAQLMQYLMGFKSLQALFLEKNKDFVYSVDIDNDLNHTNVRAFDAEQLLSDYVLEEDDLYVTNPPNVYDNLLLGTEEHAYVPSLRERALYYHIEPSNPKFLNTVSTSEAGAFLTNLTKSFKSFVAVNLFQNFKDKQGYSDLTKTINEFKKILEPRIVALSYSSFNVGISTDTVYSPSNTNAQLKKWQRGVLEQFKKDVVNVDYSSDEALESLLSKYSEEDRKQIYGPYLEIVNNSNLKVVVSDAKKSFRKTYRKLEDKEKLIPKSEPTSQQAEETVLVNATFEVPAGSSIEDASKRDLKKGLLFAQEVKEAPIQINMIESNEGILEFDQPLPYSLKLEDGLYIAESKEYGISNVGGRTREIAQRAFEDKFVEQYLRYRKSSEDSEMKSRYLTLVKSFN